MLPFTSTYARLLTVILLASYGPSVFPQEITAGDPRIWKYERVYSLVDGLLRDVEAVQLTTLTDLKPNEVNSTSVNMLQTMLRAGVVYDQAQGLQNSFGKKNLQANEDSQLAQAKQWDDQNASLRKQQTLLNDELTAASKKKRDMQNIYDSANKADQDAKVGGDADKITKADADLDSAKKNVDASDAELTETKDKIASNAAAITALPPRPQLSGAVTGGDASTLLDPAKAQVPFGSGWAKLPPDVHDALLGEIKKAPTLPASQQLDNHISLLYKRMAEELNTLSADSTRQEDKVLYLMGFDVSVFATKKQKNQVARVSYKFEGCHAKAYQLYPGMSAYNVNEFDAESHGSFFAGALKLLNGIGANADYQRLKEQLQNGVTQNVYISGFGAGTDTFGWFFGPPPYEQLVSAGVRTVYAFVSMDAKCSKLKAEEAESLKLTHAVQWLPKGSNRVLVAPPKAGSDNALALPAEVDPLRIEVLAYDPVPRPAPVQPPGDVKHLAVTVQLQLSQDVDPNLIITVAGTTLKRVRDWRGRATPPQEEEYYNFGETTADASKDPCTARRINLGRGLLETDRLCPDSWIAATPRTILMSIDTTNLAGTTFPDIRLHAGGSATDILSQIDRATQIRIGDARFHPAERGQGRIPRSAFLPLAYDATSDTAAVSVDISKKLVFGTGQIHVRGFDSSAISASHIPLSDDAQVILRDLTRSDDEVNAWPLVCSSIGGDLLCDIPKGVGSSCTKISGALPGGPQETCTLPNLPTRLHVSVVSVVAAPRLSARASFDTEAPEVIYITSSSVTEKWNTIVTTDGKNADDFVGWDVTLTAANMADYTLVQLSDPRAKLEFDGVRKGKGIWTFTIARDQYAKLPDDLVLRGARRPASWELLGSVGGIRSLLTPKITGWDPSTGTLTGTLFGGVSGAAISRRLELNPDVGEGSIILPKIAAEDAKGLLFLDYPSHYVPAMYQDRQIVYEVRKQSTDESPLGPLEQHTVVVPPVQSNSKSPPVADTNPVFVKHN